MTSGSNDTKNMKELTGSRLKDAREAKNISRQRLTDILNNRKDRPIIGGEEATLSVETLKKWEYGTNPINLEWLPVICDVLDCDAGYLFGVYSENRREISDACEITGLSKGAVQRLSQLHHTPYSAPLQKLGVHAKGYTVPNVGVLSDLIESKGYIELINSISFYLIYGGALPQDAYITEEATKPLSPEEHSRFFGWADGSGLEVVLRKDICEMHLQRASDELKNIFRDILKQEVEKRAKEK